MDSLQIVEALTSNSILEVAIGVVFVFLFVSLLVSWIQEAFAALFSLRAKHLIAVIQVLLEPQERGTEPDLDFVKIGRFTRKIKSISPVETEDSDGNKIERGEKVADFFESATLRSLAKPNKFPSFVDPGDYADYVLDYVLKANDGDESTDIESQLKVINSKMEAIANPKAREAMMAQVRRAWQTNRSFECRVANARNNIMGWYDTTIDRTDGWYKRQVQWIAFWIALALVALLNVDTFGMVWSFYKEPQLRQFVMEEASANFVNILPEKCASMSGDELETCLSDEEVQVPDGCATTILNNVGKEVAVSGNELAVCILGTQSPALLDQIESLPIGWSWEQMDPGVYDPNDWPIGWWYWVTKILGLAVTAFAVSFGAPFWHDLLGNLVNMRLTGKKPKGKDSAK